MALKANFEFLFVGKEENTFLENYSYDLFKEHGEKGGQIFIGLEVQNNPVDAEEIGKAIFETMQKVFFEDVSRDPYERFEMSLKAVNSILNEFKGEKASGYIGNLNVVITAIVEDTLYLTQTGDSEAYLIRKKYVSSISEGLSEEGSDDIFSNIANGKIEKGDFVLFSTARLLRYISKTDLGKATAKKEVPEILSEIQDIISTEILGRIGFVGIMFDEVTEEDVKTIEDSVDSATKTILESTDTKVSSEKESISGKRSIRSGKGMASVVGGFFTSLKGLKKSRTDIFQGGGEGRVWSSIKGFFSNGLGGKNKILIALVVVIVVLAGGIYITKGNFETREELKKLDEVLTSVQTKLVEAGTKGEYDKEKAKEILDKAYDDAMTVLNSGYYRDKAILFLNQIEEKRDGIDNVQRVDAPTVLADLSTKRSDVNALGFANVGDRVFVFEYNALYELVLDQIQDPLTIDDEETVIAATGFDDRNSIIFLTKSGKLIEYKDGTVSFMDTDDGSFHKAVAIDDWSNKIYLLDSAGSEIWKYTYKGTREKFGNAEEYVIDDTDLSNAVDFAIDSNVYALFNNGDINKFYAGKKAEFYINNAPFNAFSDPTVLYTNEKLDNVYVLDAQEGRVLVFAKDTRTGNVTYTTQYLFDDVGELRDLYVDPDSQKMYVLTESKVVEVGL